MSDMIIVQGEIDEDGNLNVKLPKDVPSGQVKITIQFDFVETEMLGEQESDIDLLLIDESFTGMGLTMGEIAMSPEIGIFEDVDLPDSETYVDQIRSY